MRKDGILYGDFSDHCPETFHVHTDLAFLRDEIDKNFVKIGDKVYVKNME